MEKSSGKKNTAVLISGRGSNLRSLIKYSKTKKSLIRIVLVVSDKFNAKGLNYANKSKIDNIVIKYSNRKNFEDRLLKLLKRNNVDLICLAGFMKIISSNFIKTLQIESVDNAGFNGFEDSDNLFYIRFNEIEKANILVEF